MKCVIKKYNVLSLTFLCIYSLIFPTHMNGNTLTRAQKKLQRLIGKPRQITSANPASVERANRRIRRITVQIKPLDNDDQAADCQT